MTLRGNVFAGLTNSIWSALFGLLFVPFYLKALGLEAYGLIGFFVTIQAILSLLDMGMAPTINREIARYSATGNMKEAGSLLHTLAVVYWCTAVAMILLVLALAPFIEAHWLQSKTLSPKTIENAVILIGLIVACRWPIALYQGVLIGAQKLITYSVLNMAMVTLANLGAVAVLALVSPTIEAFFIWQAGVGLLYSMVVRAAAWRIVGAETLRTFDVQRLKKVWRFTATMSGVGITALVFTQLDKLILSKILSLEQYGNYMLAVVVASGLSVLVAPIFNIIFPRFSTLVMSNDMELLVKTYRFGTRVLAAVLFPIAMILVAFAKEVVTVWTGSEALSEAVAPIISILVIGSALNGIMFFPYALQLAFGLTWIPLSINLFLVFLLAPLTIYLANTYGAIGGALAWAASQVLYMVTGPVVTHRYVLKKMVGKWLFHDVGLPLFFSILAGLLCGSLIKTLDLPLFIRLSFGVSIAIATSIVTLATTPHFRKIATNYLGARRTSSNG